LASEVCDRQIIDYDIKLNKELFAGTYYLKIKVYEEGSTYISEKTIPIEVKTSNNAEIIRIDKTILVPGHEENISFMITNVGGTSLKDITFNWINEDKAILPVGGDNTKHIDFLDVGEQVELKYVVVADTNVDAGLYELNLFLKYNDALTGTKEEIETLAGINIGGGTDFEISYAENSGTETSFNIANIGSNPAYSVFVRIPEQNGWKVTGSDATIIGNLDDGDYTVATFNVQNVNSVGASNTPTANSNKNMINNSSTNNKMTIQIAYTNTLGERIIIQKDIKLNLNVSSDVVDSTNTKFSQKIGFWSKYGTTTILLSLVILVIGLYYMHMRRKNKLKK